MKNSDNIYIENTRFIFETNFSGDPRRDTFGSTMRKANIIIPTKEQADDLAAAGFKVKCTKPHEGEEEGFIPRYFVPIIAGYRNRFGEPVKYPPRIYIVCGDTDPELLNEDNVSRIDEILVSNVNVTLNPRHDEEKDTHTLYIRNMYVEQDIDDDPYAARYRRS